MRAYLSDPDLDESPSRNICTERLAKVITNSKHQFMSSFRLVFHLKQPFESLYQW